MLIILLCLFNFNCNKFDFYYNLDGTIHAISSFKLLENGAREREEKRLILFKNLILKNRTDIDRPLIEYNIVNNENQIKGRVGKLFYWVDPELIEYTIFFTENHENGKGKIGRFFQWNKLNIVAYDNAGKQLKTTTYKENENINNDNFKEHQVSNEEIFSYTEYEYDEQRNCILEQEYSHDKKLLFKKEYNKKEKKITLIHYDDNEQEKIVIEQELYDSGKVKKESVWLIAIRTLKLFSVQNFDEQRILRSSIIYFYDDKEELEKTVEEIYLNNKIIEITKNKDGKLLRIIEYDENRNHKKIVEYEYNEAKKLIKTIETIFYDKNAREEIYIKDNKENVIIIEKIIVCYYDEDGKEMFKSIGIIHDNGNVYEINIKNNNNDIASRLIHEEMLLKKIDYEYDERGELKESTEIIYYDNGRDIKETKRKNQNRDIVKIEKYNENKILFMEIFHEYDERGELKQSKEIIYYDNGRDIKEISFKDQNRDIIKKEKYNENGIIFMEILYLYDEKRELQSSRLTIYADNGRDIKEIGIKDQKENILNTRIYNENKILLILIEYEYDEKGKLKGSKETIYKDNGIDIKEIRIKDKRGKIIK